MTETHWHYQLVRKNDYIALHEVYVDEKPGKKDKISWTEEPVILGGETRKEAIECLELALADIKKYPILSVSGKKWKLEVLA